MQSKIIRSITEALEEVSFIQCLSAGTLSESSLSRILTHTKNRSVSIISAERGENTAAENNRQTEKLHSDLKASGYGFVRGRGGYVEGHGTADAMNVAGEHSFLVVGHKGDDGGKMLGHIKKLGAEYKQESILHKPHDSEDASWHYTSGDKKGSVEHQGKFKQDNKAMYYTTISGKKKRFSFN